MEGQYNTHNPAVKRLMREAMELRNPTELFVAAPLNENLFEWHFTIRGPADSDFNGGIFHGRITLPPDYPMKPPSIIMLTPNGRFETNTKICLSISGHHPENWQPSWSIRTALLAIIGFMPSSPAGAVGSLDMPPEERKLLAKKSLNWHCTVCNVRMKDVLPPLTAASADMRQEAKVLGRSVLSSAESATSTILSNPYPVLQDRGQPPVDPAPSEGNTVTTAGSQSVEQHLRNRLLGSRAERGHVGLSYSTSGRTERIAIDITLAFFIVLLVVLVIRRVYVQNEWRFHQ
ncbi:ubiquitin conjugating enzyme E2 J1 [Trichuris trichiura]|uniref:Ubiquitin conjugating enzyme E2 J1 n=1 Tax=Trichuris trichiura TaxID=36087 RepID=A0A077ZEE5_TRITR|nr:ubiquitin conjugating enzyme E2 J1 [Trichuris trichiura]